MAEKLDIPLNADLGTEKTVGIKVLFRSMWSYKPAFIGAIILSTVIFVALFSPFVSPFDPNLQFPAEARMAPLTYLEASGRFVILGTDQVGRDLLSRIIYASRVTLTVAFSAVIVSCLIGTTVGLLAGYFRGWFDIISMRFVDIALAFPFELLALSVVAVTGPSLGVVIVVLGLRIWVVYARVVRGSALSVREKDYINGARAAGAGEVRILLRYMLPNVMTPVIVVSTLYIGRMILIESSLSFLGIGVPPPTPTWGGILGDGRAYIDTAWWIAFFPGLAIMMTVLSVNLLGDWLRDFLDPKIKT
jgi:peptide/nickel transport system permease protein